MSQFGVAALFELSLILCVILFILLVVSLGLIR